jgi:catechol 2,3-dioxygenase-like lactoylglutathione lyase family enzyme
VIGVSYFILYVKDQVASETFYRSVLANGPRLSVPGMSEFDLPSGGVLGLMPERSIKELLGNELPDPASAHRIPRAELYLFLPDARAFHQRALAAGATQLSAMLPRSWGHTAAYSLDPDGHVLAFATETAKHAP